MQFLGISLDYVAVVVKVENLHAVLSPVSPTAGISSKPGADQHANAPLRCGHQSQPHAIGAAEPNEGRLATFVVGDALRRLIESSVSLLRFSSGQKRPVYWELRDSGEAGQGGRG